MANGRNNRNPAMVSEELIGKPIGKAQPWPGTEGTRQPCNPYANEGDTKIEDGLKKTCDWIIEHNR